MKSKIRATSPFKLFALSLTITLFACSQTENHQKPNPTQVSPESLLNTQDLIANALLELDSVDILLIGESHDNPAHHQIQLDAIKYLHQQNQLGNVILEHLDVEQAKKFNNSGEQEFDALKDLLLWNDSGWPAFEIFYPIFSYLKRHDIPAIAGHVSRRHLMAFHHNEAPELIEPSNRKLIKLDSPLPAQAEAELLNRIKDAHCGALTLDHAKIMLPMQRYRDAYLAAQWLENMALSPGKTTVYLLGNEHARLDYGVPYYLTAAKPELNIVSWQLIEDQYARSGAEDEHFKHTIITSSHHREDPCESAKEQLRKYKQ